MAPDQPSQTIPFQGYVDTTGDALRLIQAARCGLIPRITRRLNELERRSMIRSGAVFVFSVDESGIKRWTEGLQWSPSRIAGNFLLYKEVIERAPQRGKAGIPSGPNAEGGITYKPHGLCKKTITVKIEGSDHHLISYFTMHDIETGRLRRPMHRPDIMAIDIPPELVQSTNFRYPPQFETGPDGRLTRIRDMEEVEQLDLSSAGHNAQPFATGSSQVEYASTATQLMHNAGKLRSFHSPIVGRNASEHSPIEMASPPPSQPYKMYNQGAHHSALRPDDSPHSPHQYSSFGSLPAHDGNVSYPQYESTGSQSFPHSTITPKAAWDHGATTTRSEHMSSTISTINDQYALRRLVPDASAWVPSGDPLSGQPLVSVPPPTSASTVSSLPMRRREHMRARPTSSTWSMDQSHGSHIHTPMARYPEEVHQASSSSASGHGGTEHSDNMYADV